MIKHEAVMKMLEKVNRPKIGDYISIAIANGMTEISVVENLTNLYQQKTGVYYWGKIHQLVKAFNEDFAIDRQKA